MKSELDKCIGCKKPACVGCPAGTDIASVIALVKEGKRAEAGEMLFNNNPFSAICGAVCPNHLFCMPSCILSKRDNAVNFSQIEAEISGEYLEKMPARGLIDSSAKVLIIGAGVAGLSLAFYLGRAGIDATVCDKRKRAGGSLWLIPDSRLDKALVQKIIDKIGVQIVHEEIDPANLPTGYDHIVFAIGSEVSNKLGIPGENLLHVKCGLHFLEHEEAPVKNTLVIGGGNVAIDCAIVAKDKGSESVAICYRKTEEFLKAYPREIQHVKDLGVCFHFNMVPTKITKKFVHFDNGKKLPADRVIVAIGQYSNTLPEGELHLIGDVAHGPSTIIKAVASAKQMAEKIKNSYIKA